MSYRGDLFPPIRFDVQGEEQGVSLLYDVQTHTRTRTLKKSGVRAGVRRHVVGGGDKKKRDVKKK